jgi:BON domain
MVKESLLPTSPPKTRPPKTGQELRTASLPDAAFDLNCRWISPLKDRTDRMRKQKDVSPEISVMPSVTGTMRCFSRTVRKRRRTIRRPTVATRLTTMYVSICSRYSTEEKQRLAEETPQDIEDIICAVPPGRGARRALCAWVSILFVTDALSGCALYDTYEKCGFRGCPGDAKITADVVLQLNRCSFMEPNVISVQTMDHVVYLNGVVRSGLEIGAAESIAGQVPGVARVVNSIVAFTR